MLNQERQFSPPHDWHSIDQKKKTIPLGQTQQKVPARPLHKARHAEPAGRAVVLAPAVARDGVAHVFLGVLLVAADLGLGRIGQVTNDGDASDGARRGGAECAGSSSGGGGGAAEKERRHDGDLNCCRLLISDWKEKKKEDKEKQLSRRGLTSFLSRRFWFCLGAPPLLFPKLQRNARQDAIRLSPRLELFEQ